MKTETRKRKSLYIASGLVVLAAIGWAASARTVDEECLRNVHIDFLPEPGETWESQSAKMDAMAREICRRYRHKALST